MEYHDICLWLPYKEELVDEIADDISHNGYREDKPIILFQNKILDGRHRYEAARKAGVDAHYQDFIGTTEQAIKYVTSENVKRRMLSSREKEFFYVQRADALGVRKREDSLKQNATDVENSTTAPSQHQHADEIGVHRDTVAKWEKDRKEIKSDPELAKKANTFDGYVEAKKEVQERRKARPIHNPAYKIEDGMGCIKGVAESFCKEYTGKKEEAADVLFGMVVKGCESDSIRMSISRDYAKWVLELKEVMDLVEPRLREFLNEEPELKVVK